jgi:hypothetical protein
MRTRREKIHELAIVHKFTLNFPVKKESRKTKKNSRDHRFHPDDNKRIEVGIAAENFFLNKMRSDPRRGRGIHAPKDQTEEEDEADAAITVLGNDQLRLHSVCRSGVEWRPLDAGNVHWDYWCK